jgi:CRISPR-associated endonuclease/helicase Cas3
MTKKNIALMPWSSLDIDKERTLVMANTRRKAATIFQNMVTKFPDTIYLSSGIRKKDKIKILDQIHKNEIINKQFILVSTQVVEAGIDISFTKIYREKAPLDSIIQVMGRLNREAENDSAKLVIFEYDTEHKPYSQLELNESGPILKKVKNSIDLYLELPKYYQSISEKNNSYKRYTNELNEYIAKLKFDEIWDFINKHVFLEEERDSVLIPDVEEWDKIKEILSKKKLAKTEYRMLSNISATLPQAIHKFDIQDYFDEETLEKNLLLPKKEHLDEVYDKRLGTDKWLI